MSPAVGEAERSACRSGVAGTATVTVTYEQVFAYSHLPWSPTKLT